jgi:protein-tyrosine phosphatase
MPGFTSQLPDTVALTPAVIEPWTAFMKQQGISTVIVLLGQDEMSMFDPPLLDVYSAQGFTAHHLPARTPGNFEKITAVMEQAVQQGARVVVHCTGGCHRVGTVLTAWLKHRHGLADDAAAGLMSTAAAEHGVNRQPPHNTVLQQYMDGSGW